MQECSLPSSVAFFTSSHLRMIAHNSKNAHFCLLLDQGSHLGTLSLDQLSDFQNFVTLTKVKFNISLILSSNTMLITHFYQHSTLQLNLLKIWLPKHISPKHISVKFNVHFGLVENIYFSSTQKSLPVPETEILVSTVRSI